jgi:hypothetical protein
VKITLSLDSSDKDKLESIATKFGYIRGSSPSISALIRAIAQGDLEINHPREEIVSAIAVIQEQLDELRINYDKYE